MHLSINFKITKKTIGILVLVVLLCGVAYGAYLKATNNNPLPDSISKQVQFKVIYPSKSGQIDSESYNYQSDQKTLTFKVNFSDKNLVFTEQPAPDTLGSGSQVYYPALGIHPYAQFQTKLGPVALTKFWQSVTLKSVGQTGVLVSHGTLLTAHSEKTLTNQQWKSLFDSLKIER